MKLKPLNNRILVKRDDTKTTSAGGIILPESAQEQPVQGIVIAVSNGKQLDNGDTIPPSVGIGDRVLFSKFSGTDLKMDGEEVLIILDDDVLAVVES